MNIRAKRFQSPRRAAFSDFFPWPLIRFWFLVVSIGIASASTRDDSSWSSGGTIDLLPVSPGDQPLFCSSDALPMSTCGVERYCSEAAAADQSDCLHKALAPGPPSFRDIFAFLVVGMCCFLAAMAGIGGGGLLMPIIMHILNFGPKDAAVLSASGVFGNCLGQTSFYLSVAVIQQRGDTRGGSSDGVELYSTVLGAVVLILPGLIAGGSVAIFLQGAIPSTPILILALVVLLVGTGKTFLKSCKMLTEEEERRRSEQQKGEEDGGSVEISFCTEEDFQYVDLGSVISCGTHQGAKQQKEARVQGTGLHTATTQKVKARGSPLCWPFAAKRRIELLVISCWALNALTFIIFHKAGIRKCSAAFFAVISLPSLFAIFFVWKGRSHLLHRREVETHLLQNEIEARTHDVLDQRRANSGEGNNSGKDTSFDILTWWLPMASYFIGILSALLGIGGGEVLGPVLLLLNMNPSYSSTTTSVIALLSSGTNTLNNFLAGRLVAPAYCGIVWSIGLFMGCLGRSIAMIIARRGKGSAIAFSLSTLLAAASVLMAYELYLNPSSWSAIGLC